MTNTLVDFATQVVRDVGLPGIFLLMALDATGVPIPSEVTMLFAGYNVFLGHDALVAVIAAGVLGDLVGASVAWGIGYFGRMELIERHGAKVHITPARIALAEKWFDRYGTPAIFFSRMVPILRTFISFPAGAAKMPYGRFIVLSALGVIPWVAGWAIAGRELGSSYHSVQDKLHYVDLAVLVVLIAGAAYLILRQRRARAARAVEDGVGS